MKQTAMLTVVWATVLALALTTAFLFTGAPVRAQGGLNPGTVPDITGTGAAVQVCATCNGATWIQLTTLSTNTSVIRWGDSNVSASRGAAIAPGGGQLVPVTVVPYALSKLYVYIANGDKLTVTYGY